MATAGGHHRPSAHAAASSSEETEQHPHGHYKASAPPYPAGHSQHGPEPGVHYQHAPGGPSGGVGVAPGVGIPVVGVPNPNVQFATPKLEPQPWVGGEVARPRVGAGGRDDVMATGGLR